MNSQKIFDLVCPVCKTNLKSSDTSISCENGHSFKQDDDFTKLVYPHDLIGNDAQFYEQYKQIAQYYDKGSEQLFATFYAEEQIERQNLVSRLQAKSGDRVFELSTGTGSNIPYILKDIGEKGEIIAYDLSESMLRIAKEKFGTNPQVKFLVGNGSYLPFPDNSFDGLFHIGGINTFSEVQKAIDEIVRIVKPGGRVVLADEGMGPWNLNTEFGDQLMKMNNLYKDQPPIDKLPVNVTDVQLSWGMGNAFYVIEFTVTEGPPKVNYEIQQMG